MRKHEIKVDGMTCHSCSAAIKEYLAEQGAKNIAIDLAAKKVTFSSSTDMIEQAKKGIVKLGYQVLDEEEQMWLTLNRKILICTLFTLPLLLDHLIVMIAGSAPLLSMNVQLLLAIPVYIIGCLHFGKSAFRALRQGKTNMDVLIFLGSTAAFVYSLVGWSMGDWRLIFFETSSLIITLVLWGNWIEQSALHRTSEEIDDISSILPQEVKRVGYHGEIEKVKLDQLSVGDHVRFNAGEYLAINGKVITGNADVQESLISGESDLQFKTKGGTVISGALVVNGSIDVMMLAPEEEGFAQKIVALIRNAQLEKPKIQKTADKISAWFVPLVISISVLCFLLEYFIFDFSLSSAILNAIAILVIACPCALGLATPAALSVGLGRLARMGVLIKGKNVIQSLAEAQVMIFDKTGTLTQHNKRVKEWVYSEDVDPEVVDEVCSALESRSNHPLAHSILDFLNGRSITHCIEWKWIEEKTGVGMIGEDTEGNLYRLIKDPHQIYDLVLQKGQEQWLGVQFIEEIKAGSKDLTHYLKNSDIDMRILSGDRIPNVKHIATALGISKFEGGLLPEDKLSRIQSLNRNARTIMLGDGMNDAPSLQLAGVGMSFANATDLAQVNSDVLLLKDDLTFVKKTIQASKQIMNTIYQNFFWAFSYNIVAIPMAALGYLNPMWAGLFMMMSDIVVIGNSLLLRRKIRS